MKSVLFRTDATQATGVGHLMRCIALAQEFQNHSVPITFLTANTFPWLSQYLTQLHFHVQNINLTESELGGEQDLKVTLAEAQNAEWVVLDNYYFDGAYQKSLKDAGARVLVLDDLPERDFCADVLLNHGMGADVLNYPDLGNAKMLLGSQYALIRSELQAHAKRIKSKAAKNILITLGGVAPVEVLNNGQLPSAN